MKKQQEPTKQRSAHKKLTLHRETLRQLEETDLRGVAGQDKPPTGGGTCSTGHLLCTC